MSNNEEEKLISQAVLFLSQLDPQETLDRNLSKLIRKTFPLWPIPLIGLVIEQSELRKKALKKFTLSSQMIFTRKGLEQSTSENLAIFTASLFKGTDEILDVCAGLGGNTIGLLKKFGKVTTVEPIALLNAIHEHNLKLYYPCIKINRIIATLDQNHLHNFPFLFIDPDRRMSGQKSYTISDHSPDINFILNNISLVKEVIIKLSPMVNADQTAAGFTSLYLADEMELKQNLWLGGSLKNTPITFAIQYEGKIFDSLHLPSYQVLLDNYECIYEMNPAIIKAGESTLFSEKFHLQPIADSPKHFIGQNQDLYPFANSWKIYLKEDFHLKNLTSLLNSLPFERFEIKPIGMEESEVKKLIRKWGKGQGQAATIFIFKKKDFKQIIVGVKTEH